MIKKYGLRILFLLCLGLVGLGGAALGGTVAMRWMDNMTVTPAVRPGERAFAMPAGSVPREGGELPYAKEEREAAAARKNPFPATPESVKRGGELWAVYCVPCHGVSAKGDGLVTTKFIPAQDLTNPDLQKTRTDGFWQHYIGAGGAVMPAYGEALSPEERWHLVNYVRTLAKR
jgi:mono/diheme cytochrome c family protein